MRTLIVLVFSCALAIPSLSQDVQIKSGDFVMNCRATDNVKSNPEFLALYQTIIEGLKTAVENNQVPLNKNIDVRGDILKSSSSGKIFNGVMVLVGTSGAEMSTLRGTFFPCKEASQSTQEYQEKVYGDYFKALTEKIKSVK